MLKKNVQDDKWFVNKPSTNYPFWPYLDIVVPFCMCTNHHISNKSQADSHEIIVYLLAIIIYQDDTYTEFKLSSSSCCIKPKVQHPWRPVGHPQGSVPT